jgi:hypothetical protein
VPGVRPPGVEPIAGAAPGAAAGRPVTKLKGTVSCVASVNALPGAGRPGNGGRGAAPDSLDSVSVTVTVRRGGPPAARVTVTFKLVHVTQAVTPRPL